MRIIFHEDFHKRYEKLRHGEQKSVDKRILLFEENPFHPLLDNHALHGAWQEYKSINITGNFRAVFEKINQDTIHFVALGTHAELYE